MSQYYNSQKTRGMYDAASIKPFKLSRSKIDLFLQCQRCFYYDRVLGVGRPPGYPFTLNVAVDTLLKREFDIHRAKGTKHPLLLKYGLDAIPMVHEKIDEWRNNFKGITFLHKKTNLLISGAIDDIWQNSKRELIIVDYKATAKKEEVKELDKEWQEGYKRQMEIYQWLFRQNGFRVFDTGYFVYCNGRADKKAFDGKLEFDITLIPYKGSDNWVEKTILDIFKCLNGKKIPLASADCDYCSYVEAVAKNK